MENLDVFSGGRNDRWGKWGWGGQAGIGGIMGVSAASCLLEEVLANEVREVWMADVLSKAVEIPWILCS